MFFQEGSKNISHNKWHLQVTSNLDELEESEEVLLFGQQIEGEHGKTRSDVFRCLFEPAMFV